MEDITQQRPLWPVLVAPQVPVEQERAEAMVEVAAVMRRQAGRLPEGDELREELLESAADYALAASFAWPDVRQLRPVGRAQLG